MDVLVGVAIEQVVVGLRGVVLHDLEGGGALEGAVLAGVVAEGDVEVVEVTKGRR